MSITPKFAQKPKYQIERLVMKTHTWLVRFKWKWRATSRGMRLSKNDVLCTSHNSGETSAKSSLYFVKSTKIWLLFCEKNQTWPGPSDVRHVREFQMSLVQHHGSSSWLLPYGLIIHSLETLPVMWTSQRPKSKFCQTRPQVALKNKPSMSTKASSLRSSRALRRGWRKRVAKTTDSQVQKQAWGCTTVNPAETKMEN